MDHIALTEPWSRSSHRAAHDASNEYSKILHQDSRRIAQEVAEGHENITHTKQPIVTGSSIIGLRFMDGDKCATMIAADDVAFYRSIAKFRNVDRLKKVTDSCAIAVGGDMGDFQFLSNEIDNLVLQDSFHSQNHHLQASNLATYLADLMYHRRSKMDPLWNTIIIAGPDHLSYVDLYGTTYESESIATGLGAYLAIPILRKCTEYGKWKNLSRQDARKAIDEAMKVLYYRDARSSNQYSFAIVNSDGLIIEKNQKIESDWEVGRQVVGRGVPTN